MAAGVLIATADPSILDDLLRLAAAADAEIDTARFADRARTAWLCPPLVLVGADLAEELAAGGLPRRQGVVLVTPQAEAADGYRRAVEIGAQDLAVLPDDEAWLIDAMASAAEPLDTWAGSVCLIGGRGGSGASVMSTMFGLVASRTGQRTLLVDGDPLGGGLDLLLGQEDAPGARWPDFVERRGRLSAAMLQESLPGVGDLRVLSWHRGQARPIPADAMMSVLDAAARGFDLVVVDLPRELGSAGTAAVRAANVTFLVVPAEVRATVAAAGVSTMLRRDATDVRLLVRGPAPGRLTAEAMASVLNLPLSGLIPNERRLASALEQGDLPRLSRRGPLADFCGRLLTELHPPAQLGEAA